MSGVARKSYNAVMARIFQNSMQQTVATSNSTRIPFRPRLPKSSTTNSSTSTLEEQSSISGLRFCLHMVVFAAPGIILSKKMCDGEKLDDIVQNTQETLSTLTSSLT